jgi:serine/threonine-protein kinase
VLFRLDSLKQEGGVAWPEIIPGANAVIYRLRHNSDEFGAYTIEVFDLSKHKRKVLVKAIIARYVPTGHLLYVTGDGTLMASRFDVKRLELTGAPVTLAHELRLAVFGGVSLSVSSNGTLAYSIGRNSMSTDPTWLSRDGNAVSVDARLAKLAASNLALSPDGSRLAMDMSGVSTASRSQDIWVKGLPDGPLSRLSFEGEQNRRPYWSRDGRDLFFVSSRSGGSALFRQRADGSAAAVRVASLPEGIGRGFESPDGRWIVAQSLETTKGGDIYVMPAGDSVLKPLLATTFSELSPTLSPDTKWIAYESDETGRPEVYVRPFPDVGASKVQVSNGGGVSPRWSSKGDEIFYETPTQELMAASVRETPTFTVLGNKRLFSWIGYLPPYDASSDGKRFAMLHIGASGEDKEGSAQLIIVMNFLNELKRLLP